MLRKACTNNNMVAAIGLLAILILGQSTLCDWFIDTIPGRIVMIALILGISYMNNTLGVVAVLLIIIMFNQSEIALFEGFNEDESDNSKTKSHHKDRVTKVTEDSHKNILLMDANGKIKVSVPNPLPGYGDNNSNNTNNKSLPTKPNNSTSTDSKSTDSTSTNTTDEGFDNMLDMEDSIKRGKPSDALSTQVPDPIKIDTSSVQGYSGFSTSTYSSM